MPLKKVEFTKEKVTLPDGRYLLYYNFNSIPQSHIPAPTQSDQTNEAKEKANV